MVRVGRRGLPVDRALVYILGYFVQVFDPPECAIQQFATLQRRTTCKVDLKRRSCTDHRPGTLSAALNDTAHHPLPPIALARNRDQRVLGPSVPDLQWIGQHLCGSLSR